MKNKIINSIILLITIIIVFILPILDINYKTYEIYSIILIIITLLSHRLNKELFPTILFFTLIHISRPVNDWFTNLINMNFPGTYYLIPIVIFTILIMTFPKLKNTISWWTRDKIDKNSILLIIGLSILSGLALYTWGNYISDDLQKFTDNLPDVPLIWIVINGIGFAILNAIAEEYFSRGMLCNGLEKIFTNKWLIIILQAIVFSIFHYNGFPGGLIGMIMVFSWSIVLGVIRYRTKGLVGVLIGHFLADLTIYFILYELK